MNGWIKIHRSLLDWEWYSDTNTTRLFLHLLLKANHKDKRWQGKVIKRGQLVTSTISLSKDTGLTRQQIRTSMDKLKLTSSITSKTTNKYTLLTIDKYDEFQKEENTDNQQDNQQPNQRTTIKQPTNNHKQEGKKERIKEGRREYDPPKPPFNSSSPSLKNISEEISPKAVEKFVNHRKSLASEISEHDLSKCISEAIKCGDQQICAPEEAINIAVEAGWKMIKSDWVNSKLQKDKENKEKSKGLEAWSKIMQIVPRYTRGMKYDLGDDLAQTTLNSIGGLYRLCQTNSFDLNHKKNEFLDKYKVACG